MNAKPAVDAPVVLSVDGLCVSYGAIEAVRDVSLTLAKGEIVTIIGANGAGKSTTLRTIVGLVAPVRGTVTYEGRPITGEETHAIVRRGLALVPEGRAIFANLSVRENLVMGAYTREDKGVDADYERVFGVFPRIKERLKQNAGTLSGGEQQMLAIGRALMSRPRVLLLDEPSLGLAPLLVHTIFESIEEVNRGGTAVLLVEQNANAALKHSHRAYVLETGAITLSGPSSEVAQNPKVKEAYLGE